MFKRYNHHFDSLVHEAEVIPSCTHVTPPMHPHPRTHHCYHTHTQLEIVYILWSTNPLPTYPTHPKEKSRTGGHLHSNPTNETPRNLGFRRCFLTTACVERKWAIKGVKRCLLFWFMAILIIFGVFSSLYLTRDDCIPKHFIRITHAIYPSRQSIKCGLDMVIHDTNTPQWIIAKVQMADTLCIRQ